MKEKMKEELYIKTRAVEALGYQTIRFSEEEVDRLYQQCNRTIKNFQGIISIIRSNRWPATVYQMAMSFGMIIPRKLLYGNKAYRYFLNNIKEYIKVDVDKKPMVNEMMSSLDDMAYIEKFSDMALLEMLNQIKGQPPIMDYDNRTDLLKKVYQAVVDIYGKFDLIHTNKVLCDNEQYDIFSFRIGHSEIRFSVQALMSFYESSTGLWYYNYEQKLCFSRMAIMQLKFLLKHFLYIQEQKKDAVKKDIFLRLLQKIEKFLQN